MATLPKPKDQTFKPLGTMSGSAGAGGVSTRLEGLLNRNNPYMKQAETQGMQAANRRGLLNTSMGVQAAQQSRVGAALPIAQQEASQAHEAGLQRRQIGSTERIAKMNIESSEREKGAALAATMESNYAQMFSNLAANPKIPSKTRDQYLGHIGKVRDSNMALVEQLYGLDLNWSTPQLQEPDGGGGGGGGGGSSGGRTPDLASPGNESRPSPRHIWEPGVGWVIPGR